jgi:four helix bundle protein
VEKESIIKVKSYAFALKTVRLGRSLQKSEKEFILTTQLIRSATSIGSNVEESSQAQSKADFIHKLSIALKETFETHYWIRLMKDSEVMKIEVADELLEDCTEIKKILVAIINTSKRNR